MGRSKHIIKELQKNDYRSFDEFYNLTSKLVYYVISDIIKNKQTVEDLMQETYLKFINNISNVDFYCGDCTEVVEKLIDGGEKADIAVVDPPRKGCDENLLTLLKNMNPEKIIANIIDKIIIATVFPFILTPLR